MSKGKYIYYCPQCFWSLEPNTVGVPVCSKCGSHLHFISFKPSEWEEWKDIIEEQGIKPVAMHIKAEKLESLKKRLSNMKSIPKGEEPDSFRIKHEFGGCMIDTRAKENKHE